jgi:hypothetical protein
MAGRVSEPIGEVKYSGEVRVRPYRGGIYLGDEHLEQLIERTLGERYSFGQGWRGYAVVSIELREQKTEDSADAA